MKVGVLSGFFLLVSLVGSSQEVISFPLSEDLSSSDGVYTLTALANEDGESGRFGTLATDASCTGVASTGSYFFEDNAGLQFSNDGFIDQAYSLEMTFKLDELLIRSTRSSDWVNLISFNQTLSDVGVYVFITTEGSGVLQFWNSSSSTQTVTGEIFNETDLFHLVLTRSLSGQFSIYVNGVVATSLFDDSADAYLPNSLDDAIYFFRDFPLEAIPSITDKLDEEASPGWVRLLNIANYEWSATEIATRFDVVCDRLTTPQFSSEGTCLLQSSSFELTTDITNADSIQWDFGDGTILSGVAGLDSVAHSYLSSGSYQVEVTTYFSGIPNSNLEMITINPSPTVDLGEDRSFSVGEQVFLSALSSGSSYLWQDGSTDSVLVVTEPGVYNVTATNEFGCTAFDEVTLTFESANIPNAFSPNGDGVNDVWVISTIASYPNHLLRLFDRQGNLIREWTDYQNDWDGSVDGFTEGRATYFYILISDNQAVARGSVSVIR